MDETQQLIAIIKDKNTSIETLNNLLNSVNTQFPMSEKALNLLNKSGPVSYNYDLHQEVLRIGSGGKTGSITRIEFDSMLPYGKLELRNDTKKTLERALSTFQFVKNEVTSELSRRQAPVKTSNPIKVEVAKSAPTKTEVKNGQMQEKAKRSDNMIKSVSTKPTQIKTVDKKGEFGVELVASQKINSVKRGLFGNKTIEVDKKVGIYFDDTPDIQFKDIQQIQQICYMGLDKTPKQEFRSDFPFESSISYRKGCWWILGKGNDGNIYTALVKSKTQIEIEAKEEAERPQKEREEQKLTTEAVASTISISEKHVTIVDNRSSSDNWITNSSGRSVSVSCKEMFGSFTVDLYPGETKRITTNVDANVYPAGQYRYDNLKYELLKGEHWEVLNEAGSLKMKIIKKTPSESNGLSKPVELAPTGETINNEVSIEEKYPYNPMIRTRYLYNEGINLNRLGRFKEAIKSLNEFLKEAPPNMTEEIKHAKALIYTLETSNSQVPKDTTTIT